MSGKTTHEWVYDGGGGGHNGEYYFTCKRCGDSDWVSYASLREGEKPNAAGCKGAKPPAPPRSTMSPEALERLLEAVEWALSGGALHVDRDDLRALLDAYDEAVKTGQAVVECTDEMREEWAETEERLIAERDAARAEGVAAERARVVAWLRAADSETLVWFAAQRIEQGWHDKEGER